MTPCPRQLCGGTVAERDEQERVDAAGTLLDLNLEPCLQTEGLLPVVDRERAVRAGRERELVAGRQRQRLLVARDRLAVAEKALERGAARVQGFEVARPERQRAIVARDRVGKFLQSAQRVTAAEMRLRHVGPRGERPVVAGDRIRSAVEFVERGAAIAQGLRV